MSQRTMLLVIAAAVVLGCAIAAYIGMKATNRDSRSYRLVALALGWTTPGPAHHRAIELPFSDAFVEGALAPEWAMYQQAFIKQQPTRGAWLADASAESVWWHNNRGPMAYLTISGDAEFTASVSARKSSDPSAPPDAEWQFGGIMLRDPASDRPLSFENYVFVVVGHRGTRLQVEYKNTLDGRSDVHALDWPSGDADLRIVRDGTHFELYTRPFKSQSPWQQLARWHRPDLPRDLQAGMIQYAFSQGRNIYDLRVAFSDLTIHPRK